jgi:hypothetical protein
VGAWPVAVAAGVVALGLSALPLAFAGPVVYSQWLREGAAPYYAAGTGTVYSLASFVGHPEWNWTLGVPLAAALVLGLAAFAHLRRPDRLTVSQGALVVSMLAAPVAWLGYLLFLLPAFFHRRQSPFLLAAAVLMLVPGPPLVTLIGLGADVLRRDADTDATPVGAARSSHG